MRRCNALTRLRRPARLARLVVGPLVAAAFLGGCASFNRLDSEVSTYGAWPAERRPAAYVFERLPSQEAQPSKQQYQQLLEDAARGALQQAGFTAAAAPQDAEYLMQVGARVWSETPWIYNDPLFWHGGARYGGFYGGGFYGGGFYGRHGWRGAGWGGGWGPGWGAFGPFDTLQTFSREIALVIRDRKSGQVLYEARADNSGPLASIDSLLPAMFEAALKGFPAVGPNPHRVTVDLSKPQG